MATGDCRPVSIENLLIPLDTRRYSRLLSRTASLGSYASTKAPRPRLPLLPTLPVVPLIKLNCGMHLSWLGFGPCGSPQKDSSSEEDQPDCASSFGKEYDLLIAHLPWAQRGGYGHARGTSNGPSLAPGKNADAPSALCAPCTTLLALFSRRVALCETEGLSLPMRSVLPTKCSCGQIDSGPYSQTAPRATAIRIPLSLENTVSFTDAMGGWLNPRYPCPRRALLGCPES